MQQYTPHPTSVRKLVEPRGEGRHHVGLPVLGKAVAYPIEAQLAHYAAAPGAWIHGGAVPEGGYLALHVVRPQAVLERIDLRLAHLSKSTRPHT